MNRIPSLDGWRGIAILLVLFDHVQRMLLGRFLVAWTETGQYGVTVFFVLSGFLITATLLGQPINLRRFYTRRLFRLMPVAWTYLVFVGIFGLLSGVNWFSWREILSCILFFRNYVIINGHGLASGHFWSLSIEEQFYLVWPTFLLLAGRRRALWGAVCGILACTIVRQARWTYFSHVDQSFHTEARADALLIGCALAILIQDPRAKAIINRWSKLGAVASALILAFCASRYHVLPTLLESLGIVGLIAYTVHHSDSHVGRALSWRPLAWLGTASYSLYVWQEFFFMVRPGVVGTLVLCTMPFFWLSSFFGIERPIIILGRRFTSVTTQLVDLHPSAKTT